MLHATYSFQKVDNFDGDANYAELGLEHFFSKRTRLWTEGYYFMQELDQVDELEDIPGISIDDSKKWAVSVGIRHDF